MRHLSDENISIIEESIKNILEALGDDPNRPGLVETPHRVAKMYDEIYEGMRYTNDEIAEMFNKCFDEPEANDLVCMTNIDTFSNCEHHLALMYNMKVSVAYIPKGKVIGLSKIARIVDMASKRLQLQERLAEDIADILEKVLDTKDVFVYIEGEHSCMTARGIKKPGTVTKSSVAHGEFYKDAMLRNEVFNLIKA